MKFEILNKVCNISADTSVSLDFFVKTFELSEFVSVRKVCFLTGHRDIRVHFLAASFLDY